MGRTAIATVLVSRLEREDCTQNGAQDRVPAVREKAILMAAVVAILVAAAEALAKVIVLDPVRVARAGTDVCAVEDSPMLRRNSPSNDSPMTSARSQATGDGMAWC